MDKRHDEAKKVVDEIIANDFAKLNGAIIRTMGVIFHGAWEKADNLQLALKDKPEGELYASLDYLQLCGAIKVRVIDTIDEVEINDFDLEEVEVRLSDFGMKLWMKRKSDELIEI